MSSTKKRGLPDRVRWIAAICLLAVLLAFDTESTLGSAPAGPVTISNYTDQAQDLPFGNRSHWKQPWRSYLDTVPAITLLNAVGINFNVPTSWAAPTARLLAESGFKRARVEVPWGNLDYDDPTQLIPRYRDALRTTLTALRENDIRPLILLNAHHGRPCPLKNDTIELLGPASAGDIEIQIDPSDLDRIVLGRTGIRSGGVAAQHLFISVAPDGTVRLSKPLVADIPAGPLQVSTLRYEPFRPAMLADGSPNPRFEPTMEGWLNYVDVVTREVKGVLGTDSFDVEVWNERSFGSRFLNINGYYIPGIEWRSFGNERQILVRTVEFLRDPVRSVPGVGIGNGFANQSPWWNGTNSPVGLTAIDKHPYAGWYSFPADAQINGNRPLNGLGELDGWKDETNLWHESFTPTYDAFFPEYFLSGIQTETLVHDLSPEPTFFAGVEHGRNTHPEGGDPPTMWITEVNLDPASGPVPRTEMSEQDVRHVETKAVLRYLVAYVNKGVTALHFYAAKAGNLSLIDQGFFDALSEDATTYPGNDLGGETVRAVGRLTEAMQGAQAIDSPRSLSLRELTDYAGNTQFEGDGSAAYPLLHDRDVFAFLPFQIDQRSFAVSVYVMTRNVAQIYDPGNPEPSRFDLPPERYRMTIGGVYGQAARVSATDPLSGESVPVSVISRSDDEIAIDVEVTDSPRVLMIRETRDPPVPPGRTATESTSADSRDWMRRPQLRLYGVRRMLRTGRLALAARCESRCSLQASGRLAIGRRAFRMRPRPRRSLVGDGRSATTFRLAIPSRAARLGRRALNRGRAIRGTVMLRSRPESGGGQTDRRTFVLRH